MTCTATLTTESADAAAVASSLAVDDVEVERLAITTRAVDGVVRADIRCATVDTLLATLDDLICCQMTAEKALN